MTYFEEFKRLKEKTPHIGIRGFKNMNCDYNDYLYFSKNCFLCFSGDKFWDSFYCQEGNALKDCCDCNECDRCELCFECIDCKDCNDGNWLQDCRRVSQSFFCYDCVGCNSCFGCSGLRQKNYCIFNRQLSGKDEYDSSVREWKMKGLRAIWAEFEKVKEATIHQHAFIYRAENSTGDHLENVKNAHECFDCGNLYDCGHMIRIYAVYGDKNADSWNCYGGVDMEQCIEMIWVGKAYNCSFLYYCEVVRDCDYCFQVFNSKNCFLCCGLNHGENMILNKKYDSVEEWQAAKASVIEHMKKDGEWGQWMLSEGEKMDC